jgi:membrane fusion protein (multidrug efflux system)
MHKYDTEKYNLMKKLTLFFLLIGLSSFSYLSSSYAQESDAELEALIKQLDQDINFDTDASYDDSKIRFLLKPRQSAILSAKISGRVVSLPFKEGDAVKKNELLMAMDCTIETAQGNVIRTDLKSAELTYKSNQRLFQRNSLGQIELKQSEIAYERAKAQFEEAQSRIRQCYLYAPFSGRVAQRLVKEYEFVQAGQQSVELFDDKNFEISLIVPSAWLAWLKVGLTFQTEIDETGELLTAQITRIGSKIDSISKSVTVTAEFTDKSNSLVYGMSGSALFDQQQLTQ